MSVTMADVKLILDNEEPDYIKGAMLGPEALPHLHDIVQNSEDNLLAAKATFLSSMIPHEQAVEILHVAASRQAPEVRVAAAAAARNLMSSAGDVIASATQPTVQQRASNLIVSLLQDADSGVRKVATKTLQGDLSPRARDALRNEATKAPEHVKSMLNSTLGIE